MPGVLAAVKKWEGLLCSCLHCSPCSLALAATTHPVLFAVLLQLGYLTGFHQQASMAHSLWTGEPFERRKVEVD